MAERGRYNAVVAAVRDEIVADYRTMGAKKVGEKYGIHRQTVLNLVRAAGEPIRKSFYSAKYQAEAALSPEDKTLLDLSRSIEVWL